MGITFNPLIFSGLDFTGGSVRSPMQAPVANMAALPTTGNADGDVRVTLDNDRVWVWNQATSRWIEVGLTYTNGIASSSNANGVVVTRTDVSTNATQKWFQLTPADGSNPGVVTTAAQTIAGPKTLTSTVYTNAGIDVTTTAGTDTLSIGAVGADVINIGNPSCVVNIQGTTVYENTQQLQVADALITINKGGATGSAQAAGIELEENSVITGYFRTSNDRNTWQIKPPNVNGVATIAPGSSGITLNQSSHDPVTLGTANGLSLSTQVLSLGLSSTSTTGALSSTDWNTFNGRVSGPGTSTTNAVPRFGSTTGNSLLNSGVLIDGTNNMSGIANLTATGTTTLATTLSGPIRATSGVIGTGNTNLASEVTGTLPIANGGTGGTTQQTALNNLTGTQTSGRYVRSDGTNSSLSTIQAADVPTLNQNTTGTAANVTGIVAIVNGGTGSSTRQAAINALTGTQATGTYLRSDGTNSTLSAIQAADVPTLNQNTTGTAANITATSNSTLTTLSSLSLPFSQTTGTVGVTRGGTGNTATLVNNQIMVSSGGVILEGGAMTNGQLMIGNSGGAPIAANITQGSGISITNAANSITVAMAKPGSAGDLSETSFTGADNQAAAANLTGCAFANATVRAFVVTLSIVRNSTYSLYMLRGIQKAASWEFNQEAFGDDCGIIFSLTTAGQVQYTSTSTGFTPLFKFRATTTTV